MNPETSFLKIVMTVPEKLPIPIKRKRISPGMKKSMNGEFARIALEIPFLCPVGSMRNKIPAGIAAIATNI
jgi:hypothetical protein